MYDTQKPYRANSDRKSVSREVGTHDVLYVLALRPLASDVPPEIRLRQALKVLLRRFNLRCVDYSTTAGPADDGRPMPFPLRGGRLGSPPRPAAAMPEIRQKKESHSGQ